MGCCCGGVNGVEVVVDVVVTRTRTEYYYSKETSEKKNSKLNRF